MTIQQFIEKAREGDYNPKRDVVVAEVFLDPESWKAVVRIRETEKEPEFGEPDKQFISDIARTRMHRMVDALCDGKTIEEFLSNL